MFLTHQQMQHQRTEQTPQRHRQESVPGGAHQPSERKWKEPRVPNVSLYRVDLRAGTSGSHLLLCQTRGARGRGEHGSGGRVEKGYVLWSSFISDHGSTVETPFHVHRRRTDGMRQKYFRDAYATSICYDDRSTPRTDHVVLRRMARGLRNDRLSRRAVRGRVAGCEHVRFVDEEPHRYRRSHGRNGRTGHDLVL